MKKVLSVLATGVLVASLLSTTAFAAHGGGHHSGEYYGSQSSYSAPRVDSVATVDSAVEPAVTLLAATVCEVEGCTIIGEHTHDDGNVVAHYYGDGHDNHSEYDHYYGDGHEDCGYHTSCNHAYHAGEFHH